MSELKAVTLDRPVGSSEKDEGIESRSPNDDAVAEYEYPTGPALTMVLTSVTLAYFLLFLDLAVISTATPAITSQFDSLVDVGWYGGAYQLGSAAFQSLSGKIYNQFSIKVRRAVVQSAHNFLLSTARGFSDWGFYINLPLGLIVGGFLLLNKIPEPKEKRPPLQTLRTAVKSLDLPGFMLICPAVIMLLLGLQFGGNQYPWNSSVVIGLIIGGMVTLAVFLFWEHRQGDDAMVPFAMVRHRVIWSAAMTMFFGLSSILIGDFYVAIYFQAIRNDSPLMSGVHMLPVTLGLVVFTMLSGTMNDPSDAASPQRPYQNAHGELHEIATKELYTTPRASVTVTVDTLDGEEMWNLEADEFSDEDDEEVEEGEDQDVAAAAGDGSFKGPTIEVCSAGESLTIGEYVATVHPWLVSLRAKYLWEHGILMGYEPLPQETRLWVKPTDAEDVVLLDSVNHGADGTHEWRDIAKSASNMIHAPFHCRPRRIDVRRAADVDWDSVDIGPFCEHIRDAYDGQARLTATAALFWDDAELI
ncbi:hypothetical protein K4F52_006839 [Lecanicillium sp. MT-2017a]|nr:hypothetical protein K4F52_006839 [Lecanicillium sp. MT-2017a]